MAAEVLFCLKFGTRRNHYPGIHVHNPSEAAVASKLASEIMSGLGFELSNLDKMFPWFLWNVDSFYSNSIKV